MNTLHGDSLHVLKTLDSNSFDCLVTDPPYGLSDIKQSSVEECLKSWLDGNAYTPNTKGFMGKPWDSWTPSPSLFKEVFRVLKPGSYGLVFASSRTQDLMSLSLRLAGFEIRDTLMFLYSSGFPKGTNCALAIDKELGHGNRGRAIPTASSYQASDLQRQNKLKSNPVDEYGAKTEEGQKWQGYNTNLKPAYEPIILIRKPLEGTVAQNILKHGVGGINIDACRIPLEEGESTFVSPHSHSSKDPNKKGSGGWKNKSTKTGSMNKDCLKGRWPSNVLLSCEEDCTSSTCLKGCPVPELNRQSGIQKSGRAGPRSRAWGVSGKSVIKSWSANNSEGYGDKGGASRFFFTAKASKKEKSAGIKTSSNIHPTVKPLDLMRYLVKLVCPPDGVVLDPFLGSGSTLCACALEGVEGVGIEREEEYLHIARQRITYWESLYQPSLF